jgi:hypothetical protein
MIRTMRAYELRLSTIASDLHAYPLSSMLGISGLYAPSEGYGRIDHSTFEEILTIVGLALRGMLLVQCCALSPGIKVPVERRGKFNCSRDY